MRPLLGLAAALALAAGVANAADPPPPAKPTAIYVPTSLKPDRGLPRTSDGHPDLQGTVWEANFFAPLQAPKKGPAPDLILPEAAAKAGHDAFVGGFIKAPFLALDPEATDLLKASRGFPLVRGQRHSRLLVLPADGRLPLTPAAQKDSETPGTRERESDNPENRNTMERCLNMGATPPMAMMSAIDPWEFIQTADHIVIHTESGDEVRIIPFARTHGPAAAHPAMGDSIARWEGDTLVVETVNFLLRDRTRGSLSGAFLVNPDARVIERFTRVSKDELVYQFTVEDPKVYAAPWLAEFSLYRASYRMFPSSCHEGNYGLPNILAGAREEERVAAAKPAATATAQASTPEPAFAGRRP
jgi:hypothetical protein